MKNGFYCSVEYKTAATVCTFKIINTPLTTVQLALLMTNEQTGKLFKEKRNSQELSRKELRLAGVQFSDYRGSPTSTDSTKMKFKTILIPPTSTLYNATSPQLTQRSLFKEKHNSKERSRKELSGVPRLKAFLFVLTCYSISSK